MELSSLPTQLQLPPHPAQPGAGSSCGGTRTRDLSGTFRCPSALVLRSGPRHPGSQRRVLLCHTDLDKFLADSATSYPNSGLQWSCRTPDSTLALVYHGYRCSNEVLSRVCTILTHTAARIHLLSAFHASSASPQEVRTKQTQQASASSGDKGRGVERPTFTRRKYTPTY